MKTTRSTRTIEQVFTFKAAPKRVYRALMDSAQHAFFTGDAATIDPRPGGTFTCYGGYITGFNLELEPNKRIVQAWRSRNWPKGRYSIVSFTLKRMPTGKTELSFVQEGVPSDDYVEKNKGWKSHYWKPLELFLDKTKHN